MIKTKLNLQTYFYVLLSLIALKLLISGLSFSDSLGALVLLSIFQLERALSHALPKRVDLYKEHSLVQAKVLEIQAKTEALERDFTAFKMSKGFR